MLCCECYGTNLDTSELECADGGGGEEGGEQEVIPRGHHRHLVQVLVEVPGQSEARPAAAQHHHPRLVGE